MDADNAENELVNESTKACSSSPNGTTPVSSKRNGSSTFSSEDENDEDNEEDDKKNSIFGFLFGNVDDSGELDADYFDEDAKEHLSALAGKLGPSLSDIDVPFLKQQGTIEDYSEQGCMGKAVDAVDYEGIEEEYEETEEQGGSCDGQRLSKGEYDVNKELMADLSKSTASINDEDNYDEEEDQGAKEDDLIETHIDKKESPDISPTLEELPLNEMTNEYHGLGGQIETKSDKVLEEKEKNIDNGLPILYKEDGKIVLRFSEIFGTKVSCRPVEKKCSRRDPILKRKAYSIQKDDVLEDDEECLLKASTDYVTQFFFREFHEANDDFSGFCYVNKHDFSSFDSRETILQEKRHSCSLAQPMKTDCIDSIVNHMDSLPSCFYSFDQLHWEDKIIWDMHVPPVNPMTQLDCGHRKVSHVKDGDDGVHSNILDKNHVFVESLGSISYPEDNPNASRKYFHPQMLRLESCPSAMSDIPISDLSTGLASCLKDEISKCFKKLSLQNNELLEDSWMYKIIWDETSSTPEEKIIFNLQDDQMVFEALENKEALRVQSHAGAVLINPSNKAISSNKAIPSELGDLAGQTSTVVQFNISNDKYYSNRKSSQQQKSNTKKRGQHSTKVLHSLPAMKLQTMKPKLNNKDLSNFHRPKALWYPHHNEVAAKEQGKLFSEGPMKIIVKSLGGKASKLHVDAAENLESVKAKAAKKLDFKSSETVKFLYSGKELKEGKSLAQQLVCPNSVLHVVRSKVHPWPKAQRVPNENKPKRPPGAFRKKSELSVKDGHVFLMEYCEERPLLLGNVGMGARLLTYYQKSTSTDQNAANLQNESNCLGTIVPLEPTEKSPFLGDIKGGYSQCSIETNMYRAPVFQHKVAYTDFLLVRSSKGKISLRRIDNLYVVGQQEPHMEVLSPGSKNLQNYLSNRLLAYVYREFRASERSGKVPYIRADELAAHFPNYSESFLRKRLKHCAELQKGSNGEMLWVIKRNFRLPSEEELRSLVAPENVCAYESMQAGLHHLKRLGIHKLTGVSGIASAMSQLPDEAVSLATASHIERELQMTSWNLSCNFVASTMQGRECIERLEITGAGDPSGRGLGFSYLRVPSKPPVSSAVVKKKTAVARGNSAVTGTDADLRRLSMDAAREVLLKFSISEEQIEKMGRWERIAMVRRLSSEQAASGIKVDATVLNKFARGQRMSFLQLQQQAREKCQEIWDRQIQNLSASDIEVNECDSEENSDLDSYIGDLENLLDAEEAEEGEEGDANGKRDRREIKGTAVRKRVSLVQVEEEMEDEAAEAAELCRMLMDDDGPEERLKRGEIDGAEKKDQGELELRRDSTLNNKDEGNRKTKKVYKRIIRTTKPDGTVTSREIPITDPKEVAKYLSKKKFPLKGKKKNDNRMDPDLSTMTDGMNSKDRKELKVKKQKEKPVRDNFICGACGQSGHMRTNKKCPMYMEDTDTILEKPEVDHVKQVPKSAEDLHQSVGSKSKSKKKFPKSSKQAVQVTPDVEDFRTGSDDNKISGKSVPLKFVFGSSSNKRMDEAMAEGTAYNVGCYDAVTDNVNNNSKIVTISTKNKKADGDKESLKEHFVQSERKALPSLHSGEMGREHKTPKIKFKKPKEIPVEEQRKQKTRLCIEDMEMDEVMQREKDEARAKEMERQMQAVLQRQRERKLWEEREKKRVREEKEKIERRLREEQERQWEAKRREEEMLRRREEIALQKAEEERMRIWREKLEYEAAKREEKRKKSKQKQKELIERQREQEVVESYEKPSRHKRHEKRVSERDRGTKRHASFEYGRTFTDHVQPTKRRRGGEVILSNLLETIVDRMRNRTEISYLFLKPVTKKEAPDYFQYIKHPMDLSTIRQKVKRLDYKSRNEFRNDVLLITYNAHTYNENRNPGIPPLADQLLQLCDSLLEEYDAELTEAEAAIERI